MKIKKSFFCNHGHVSHATVEDFVSTINCVTCGLEAKAISADVVSFDEPNSFPEMVTASGCVISGSTANCMPSWIDYEPLRKLDLSKETL